MWLTLKRLFNEIYCEHKTICKNQYDNKSVFISLWKCVQLGNIQVIVIINNVSQSSSFHNINFWEEKK